MCINFALALFFLQVWSMPLAIGYKLLILCGVILSATLLNFNNHIITSLGRLFGLTVSLLFAFKLSAIIFSTINYYLIFTTSLLILIFLIDTVFKPEPSLQYIDLINLGLISGITLFTLIEYSPIYSGLLLSVPFITTGITYGTIIILSVALLDIVFIFNDLYQMEDILKLDLMKIVSVVIENTYFSLFVLFNFTAFSALIFIPYIPNLSTVWQLVIYSTNQGILMSNIFIYNDFKNSNELKSEATCNVASNNDDTIHHPNQENRPFDIR